MTEEEQKEWTCMVYRLLLVNLLFELVSLLIKTLSGAHMHFQAEMNDKDELRYTAGPYATALLLPTHMHTELDKKR